MLLRFQWQIKTRTAILWRRKNGTPNFVAIFKTLLFDRNKRQKKSRILMRNSWNHSWTNYLSYPNIMTPHNVKL